MKRIFYRVWQFQRAYTEMPSRDGLERAEAALNPDLFQLFERMQPFEQAHAIRVFDQLLAEGYTHPDLLTAALLHDVGKMRVPLNPWERAVGVLAKKILPVRGGKISSGRSKWWSAGIEVAEKHASWGAELAVSAGASPLAFELIARHQDSNIAELEGDLKVYLTALQRADSEN